MKLGVHEGASPADCDVCDRLVMKMLLALRTSTLGGRSPCRWLPELRHNESRDKKSGRRVGGRLLAASWCLSRALTLRRRLPLRREGGGRSLRERKKKQEKETRHPISNREKKSVLTLKCVRFPTCVSAAIRYDRKQVWRTSVSQRDELI